MSHLSKYKTPGNLKARVEIGSSKFNVSVQGKVYPFINHFHSVSFSAEVKNPSKGVVVGIGHGGCSFTGNQAVLIAKATQEALAEAQRYGAIIDEFMEEPETAATAIIESLTEQDFTQATEYLCLTHNILEDRLERSRFNRNLEAAQRGNSVFEVVVRSHAFIAVMDALEDEIADVEKGVADADADIAPAILFALSLMDKINRLPNDQEWKERLLAVEAILESVRVGDPI